jgi:alginate O-acetyltransferase complex protein AlgI
MIFSSVAFIFYFLPLFLVFYYLCGARNGALLVGSAIFYTWGEGPYLFLLVTLVAANFCLGLKISQAEGASRSTFVIAGVAFNLLMLAFFKYAEFVIGIVGSLTGMAVPTFEIHLPLGISFFTFQLISYLVDVGRGSIPVERGIIRFSTYVMMFPHLIAGPIVRYADINRELFQRTVHVEKFGLGVQYFIVGLCQKVLIANTVSTAADAVFAFPSTELTALVAWIGVTAYSLQIHFDFCGYSNMAIGLAFMLGFRFPQNFNYPYMSRSITEFWRRWHMSLSFWFRDYVYIPLGGNRCGPFVTARNLLIAFFLTGLWHGASWTFVLWGMFHGTFIMLERVVLRGPLERVPAAVSWAYAMLVVMVGWVLFRTKNLDHAWEILSAMLGMAGADPKEYMQFWFTPEVAVAMFAGLVFSFPVVPCVLGALGRPALPGPTVPGTAQREIALVHPIPVTVLILGLFLSSALLASSNLTPFLYFRF